MLHYQSDVMMNGAILWLLILSWFSWYHADFLFALGIGIYILYCALRMGYGAVQTLLDWALPDSERQTIIDIIIHQDPCSVVPAEQQGNFQL